MGGSRPAYIWVNTVRVRDHAATAAKGTARSTLATRERNAPKRNLSQRKTRTESEPKTTQTLRRPRCRQGVDVECECTRCCCCRDSTFSSSTKERKARQNRARHQSYYDNSDASSTLNYGCFFFRGDDRNSGVQRARTRVVDLDRGEQECPQPSVYLSVAAQPQGDVETIRGERTGANTHVVRIGTEAGTMPDTPVKVAAPSVTNHDALCVQSHITLFQTGVTLGK